MGGLCPPRTRQGLQRNTDQKTPYCSKREPLPQGLFQQPVEGWLTCDFSTRSDFWSIWQAEADGGYAAGIGLVLFGLSVAWVGISITHSCVLTSKTVRNPSPSQISFHPGHGDFRVHTAAH